MAKRKMIIVKDVNIRTITKDGVTISASPTLPNSGIPQTLTV